MPRILVSVLISILLHLKLSEGVFVNLKVYEYEWLKKILTDPLNNVHIRPTILNTSEPIEISVSLFVRNFELIDDKKMEYSIQVTLRQEWEDDRLAYSKFSPVQLRQIKYLTLLETDKIWRPDTYFKNEKTSRTHEVMKPNNFARIYANGTVFLSTRISLTLACPMSLRYYPFDHPTCNVKLASYAFARDDLIYKWKPVPNPISVSHDISLAPEFVFDSVTSNYCDAQTTTGVFSCLIAEFNFSRSRSFYLKQNFIPLANMVIVAWFSFLLDFRSEKTFLLRGIICLVALSVAFMKLANFGEFIPKTTYTTAMDFWNGISLTFIFVAFAEFIIVYYLSTHDFDFGQGKQSHPDSVKSGSKRNSGLEDIEMMRKGDDPVSTEPENFEVERKKSVEVQTHWSTKFAPEKIEKWTLIMYPCIYAGFNFIFWLVCSSSGESDR